ncbi:aldehyde dehydrogenase (NAD(P)(+)) ald5 [Savitreella phatthalungensis]
MSLTETITLSNGKSYEQPTGLFINNEWVKSKSGQTFETINPTNGKPIVAIQEAQEEDVDVAVAAARAAFQHGSEWRSMSSAGRGKILMKLADLIEADLEQIAQIESLDNGKPLMLSRGDIGAVAACIRYYAGWADKVVGETADVDPYRFGYTRHEPIGVCGQVIPWNFPALMFSWKIAPALATGNTVVLKSAEQTPLSALYMCNLLKKAGLPKGVFNLVSGFGKTAGAAIASHMDIDKVAFTGSTLVGRQILKAAASSNLKKVTLELGGKSPNIVFDDADMDQAIAWSSFGIYYNGGQVCCAGSRIFVQEGIYDDFVKRFKERAQAHQVGDPLKEETFQGPQVSQLQFDRIMGYIKSGRDEGATIALGGERVGDEGYFIQPTVITDAKPDMKVMREEIFGPVVAISKFTDIEDALRQANDTTYGLASGLFTRNLNTAIEVSNRLQAGTVWVNSWNTIHHQLPFGGYKTSGIGRELGKYALDNYTQVKTVQINLGMPNP